MKKLISTIRSLTMSLGSFTVFAEKNAPAIPDSGYQISLDSYNLRSNGTQTANVSITKDGEEYTGGVTISVEGGTVNGRRVSSTVEGIHKVTAEVDGETLITYFAYVDQYGSCAVKNTTPVFFEDFQDDTYEGNGAADLLDITKYTGVNNTTVYKWTDGATEGNRPGNTSLNLATSPSEAFQTPAFGPALADYTVEYFFRGQSYNGSAQTVIGTELGLRYSPTEALPWNAYRIVYAPYGKRNGNSSIATSGATRIWDVLAIGRTGKNGLKNGVPGYWLAGIQTSSSNSGQSYTYDSNERTIPLTSQYAFAEDKFYKMSAFAFSDTVAAKIYDHPSGTLLKSVSADVSSDYNLKYNGVDQTAISRGRTLLGAQEYSWSVDDLAIYKLYNCKNIYANEISTAAVGEAVPISITLNGVDNNVIPQEVVNYNVFAKNLTVYTDGLDFSVDNVSSTVIFRKAGYQIIPMEYVGVNGVKKGIVKKIAVNGPFQATVPQISMDGNTATATTTINNKACFDHTARVYLALYSADEDRFMKVAISDIENFAPNTADTMTVSLTMPEGVTAENSYLKAFVWEDVISIDKVSL